MKKSFFETNNTGNIRLDNIFVDAQYEIDALRDGVSFAEVSLANLTHILADGWANLELVCPKVHLNIQVLDSKGNPVPEVHVNLHEASSGLLKETAITNSSGWVSFTQLLGKYEVEAYTYSSILRRDIILDRALVNLKEGLAPLILRGRMFNLSLSILVVDRLGHPVSNVIVKVEAEGVEVKSLTTSLDGKAVLDGLVGGDYRVSVYVLGRLCEVSSIRVDSSREITFKLDRYLVLAGHLIEVGQLVGLVSVGLIAAVALLALIHKRIPLPKIGGKSL